MRKLLWVPLFLLGLTALPARAQKRPQSIKKLYVVAARCHFTNCWQCSGWDGTWKPLATPGHGDLHVVYVNGRDVRVTNDGSVVGKSNWEMGDGATNAPQMTLDHRLAGWTRGFHAPCRSWSIGGTMFCNNRLVLYRDGRILRVLQVPLAFITGWRFWNGGKQVAVGNRGHHGVGVCYLFEVRSGLLLQEVMTPQAAARGLKWARGLTP